MMVKSDKSQNKTILITIAVALTFSLFFLSEISVSFGQTNASKSSSSNISNIGNSGRGNSNLKTTPLGVRISNFRIDPSTVHVGDNFTIGATITNNSPHIIKYGVGACLSPLSATFNKNVYTSSGAICFDFRAVTLNPGEKAQITGPDSGTTYTATGTGPTKAKITFNDGIIENNVDKSIITSKSVTFMILK